MQIMAEAEVQDFEKLGPSSCTIKDVNKVMIASHLTESWKMKVLRPVNKHSSSLKTGPFL